MISLISSNLIRMVGIPLKLYHGAPLLLRAFDLSKQHFYFFQNSKVSSFSDHCPAIHNKSYSFPRLSFLPKNPSFGHFPSIASSVARMHSDEWCHRQPSCLDEVHTHNPTPKVPTHLSTSKDPSTVVYASAIAFLCENSPNSSIDASFEDNNPLTMLASSLMQMWWELEDEIWVYPTPLTSVAATFPIGVVEEHPGWLDECDESELSAKSITRNAPATALFPLLKPSPTPSSMLDTGGKILPIRGWIDMEDLILKQLEDERRREVAVLAECHLVSLSPFRVCIQSFIWLRSLQQEVAISKHQQWSQKLKEAEIVVGSNNVFLSEDSEDSEDNQLEFVCTNEIESSPHSFYSPQPFLIMPSQNDDDQQQIDASWEERSFCRISFD